MPQRWGLRSAAKALGLEGTFFLVEAGAAGGGGCAEIEAAGTAKLGAQLLGSLGLVDPQAWDPGSGPGPALTPSFPGRMARSGRHRRR